MLVPRVPTTWRLDDAGRDAVAGHRDADEAALDQAPELAAGGRRLICEPQLW